MTARAETVTILFTDLVGSTELLQRAGDEKAQHIFKAHRRLLHEAVEAHGGHEVKWLGDGLMVAFDSTRDAVKCAIAMQQSSRRPTAGERLEIRAGINVGEVRVDDSDYFGTPVVVARRLCDRAGGGQIFASDIVARLLDGHGADLSTRDLGLLALKGITNAVPAVEIIYEFDPMALLRKLPFVGRQAEYETLTKKLVEAHNSRGSIVLLAGEPGIGKTRLTEEFCEHALPSATVIRGNCYEGDVAAPFGPWTEALRSLIEQLPDAELRGALGPGAADLSAMLPEIRRRLTDIEEASRLDPESERARLFESIGAFLRNASRHRPLVIFLDDLHWCDRPSLALLEQIARRIVDGRIVIVGTYRDVEVDRVHPLAQTLATVRRMEHYERLAISGFTEKSVYDLVSAIEPSAEAEPEKRALAALLHTEADGNPFFMREVLNNLIETGKLVQEGGVWTGAVTSIEELGIPEGIKEVIGRRLSRLSDGCNRMLKRASAMTSGFTWRELQAICEDTEDELLDALDEALGSQLIVERSRSTYAFTHALIRATLYEELSAPRRVMLHRRVGESLELLYADDLDTHLGELAAHYLASAGGDAQKAVEYSIRAGDRARELVAWEEAAAHYQHALEAMTLAKGAQGEERCRILLSLADCHFRTIQLNESLDLLREAAALARDIRSADLFAQAAISFEDVALVVDADLTGERVSLLDEAFAMLEGQETPQRVLVLCRRVRAAGAAANARAGLTSIGIFAYAGDKDASEIEHVRAAAELAERLGDDLVTAEALGLQHDYVWPLGGDHDRLALTDRQLVVARRAGSGWLEADALNARACDLLALGDVAEFRSNLEQYTELVRRLRWRSHEVHFAAMPVGLAIAEGRLAQAELGIAEYAAQPTSDALAAYTSLLQRYNFAHMQGQLPAMEDTFKAIADAFPGVPIFTAAFAWTKACADKATEAGALLDRLVRPELAGIPSDVFWKLILFLMADTCADVEHRAAALPIHDALVPYASTYVSLFAISAQGSMARVVGRLAGLLERWDEAEQHFETALEMNERAGFSGWTAWTRLNYGEMLLRRAHPGDSDRAVALLDAALAFARNAGMGKVQADSERLLAGVVR